MSFSVKLPALDLEWSGATLNTVFAQRRNLVRPRFLLMLREVLRFNQTATALAASGTANLAETIGAFLDRERFSADFRAWYFMPMIACIWSCPTAQMLQFPIATMLRFCHNHGLLQVENRPQWWTVKGGARHYIGAIISAIDLTDIRLNAAVTRVERMQGGLVRVATAASSEHFDHVIMAGHPDQSLAALAAPTAQERAVLAAIRYQANEAVLHTDASVLPKRRLAWAAWNYESRAAGYNAGDAAQTSPVCLHYLLNKLQPLPFTTPVVVSLNPLRQPAESTVIKRIAYDHPVFDQGAIAAQLQLQSIQGHGGVWFGGAWAGYGFHEDGLKAGLAVAEHIAALAT